MGTFTVIKANQSLSSPIQVGADKLVNIIMPAAMQGSTLTFQAAPTADGPYQDVYLSSGAEFSVPVAANRYIVDILELVGVKFLKIRTGTSAAPIVQNADRSFGLEVK